MGKEGGAWEPAGLLGDALAPKASISCVPDTGPISMLGLP